MSNIYALLDDAGNVKTYPITQAQAQASGLPLELLAPVVSGITPTPALGEAVYARTMVEDGVVFVFYDVRKRALDEMMSELERLLGMMFARVEVPAPTKLLMHHVRGLLVLAVQGKLDDLARQADYVDFNDLVSFSKSSIDHYRQQALVAIELRDRVWVEFDKYVSSAEAKLVPYPSGMKMLMDRLPALVLVG